MKTEFYRCDKCGNVVMILTDGGGKLHCCGAQMEKIEAKIKDEGKEKHLPVYSWGRGGSFDVKIGALPHPMTNDHHIDWLYLELENGGCRFERLPLNGGPICTFPCLESKPISIYAYCNIHGLWKVDVKEEKNYSFVF